MVVLKPKDSATKLYVYHHFGDNIIKRDAAGRVIKVKSKDDEETAYADGQDIPNDIAPSLFVKAGDTIDAGTPLGLAGNTGAVMPQGTHDGTHLHYGVVEMDPGKNLKIAELMKKNPDLAKQLLKDFEGLNEGKVWNVKKGAYDLPMTLTEATDIFLRKYKNHIYADPSRMNNAKN